MNKVDTNNQWKVDWLCRRIDCCLAKVTYTLAIIDQTNALIKQLEEQVGLPVKWHNLLRRYDSIKKTHQQMLLKDQARLNGWLIRLGQL